MTPRSGAVFAFCLLLAFALLFLDKLSRKYIAETKALVRYVQMPAGKISSSPLPSELTLYIETNGFRLLWSRMMKPAQVQINLSSLKTDYLPTTDLVSVVSSQLSSDFRLIEIFPDTLFFSFDNSISKKVPVVPDIAISFKKKFDFTEPLRIAPDSVLVTGPQNLVDTIVSWRTRHLMFEGMDKSVQDEIEMTESKLPSISVRPEKVRYTIAVEEYTEKTLEVEIGKMNVPEKKEINIYPNKATLVFRVGLSNYESVSGESFEVAADFSGLDISRSKYVTVKMIRSPAYIKNLDYSPKSVEYIIYR